MPIEETGPLHPTSASRDADANSHSKNNPPGSIAAGLLSRRIARNEPPGRAPSDSGKKTTRRGAIPGATAHCPSHAAQSSEQKRGEEQVVGQAASAFEAHEVETNFS